MPNVERIKKLLKITIQKAASDLHLVTDLSPIIRVDGSLFKLDEEPVLSSEDVKELAEATFRSGVKERLEAEKEVDYSFGFQDHRFRANVFYERGTMAAAFRAIPAHIRSLQELSLPPILERFTVVSQGLVIIAGPSGHGKSTTLAALIELINQNRSEHIITIEDPIEYVFKHRKSVVSQREVGGDTRSFARALRASLREDPNVILVGEMRDLESIEATLTLAETGHLIFTTLHTNTAAQTADRVVDVFPAHKQPQIRLQLANVLLAIVSQRLIPRVKSGRIVAAEVMIANSAIKSLIREGKTHQIPNIIQTSAAEGMITLDKVLAELVSKGEVSIDEALSWVIDQKSFKAMVY